MVPAPADTKPYALEVVPGGTPVLTTHVLRPMRQLGTALPDERRRQPPDEE